MKERAYRIFVCSSGKDPGWIAMASFIPQMKSSVSALSPLNLSGSAALTEQVEEMLGGCGNDNLLCCSNGSIQEFLLVVTRLC